MGHVNGSDILVSVAGGAIGHSTSHSATFTTETKDVAVKPAANVAASSASLFKGKRVIGLSMMVKAEGMKFYNETESGFKVCLASWKVGQPVAVKLFERGKDNSPYCSGNFIITTIEETNPAGEDATYSVTLDNDGAVTIDESKITEGTASTGSGSGSGLGS